MAKASGNHPDAAEDKKMFSSMLKKALKKQPEAKVSKHLHEDIKTQKRGIAEDKKLMKSLRKKGKY